MNNPFLSEWQKNWKISFVDISSEKNIEITACISVLKMILPFWKKKNKEFRIFTTAEQNLCISTILWNLVQSRGSMFLDYKNFAVLMVYKTMLFNVLNKNVTQLITLLIFVGKHSKNTLNIKSNIVLLHVHIHIQNSLYMIDILNP